MAKKIYVGNLNYATTDDQLSELFAQYGTVVSASVVVDRYTDRSRGFGFVEMESEDAATAAISALDGTEFDGRSLRVNEANERPRRQSY
jgi:RNA recognition motif-containing protein